MREVVWELDRRKFAAGKLFNRRNFVFLTLFLSFWLGPHLIGIDGSAERTRWYRLSRTSKYAADPEVKQEALRQLKALEESFRYRFRNAVTLAPTAMMILLFLVYAPYFRRQGLSTKWAITGCCPGCGYDRSGLSPETHCPECNEPCPPLKRVVEDKE